MAGKLTLVPNEPSDGQGATKTKVLLHLAYPLWRKHTLVTLARARELQDNGNDVVVTYCNAVQGTCAVNYFGNPAACAICRHRVRTSAEAAGLKAIPLDASYRVDGQPPLSYSEKRPLLEGVHSGLISTFRTMQAETRRHPILTRLKRNYFRHAERLLKSMKAVIAQERPDRVEVFNGRHACSRFSLIAANQLGLPFNTVEVTDRQKPIVFDGHLVHDRHGIQRRILAQEPDWEAAETFYRGRREPRQNKFAKRHGNNFAPPDATAFQKRISIFLSSQDEYASLGKDWDTPFLDYAPIVAEACRRYPEYQFCIRFHPNQADMVTDVITPFREIEQLPNVVVYYPTDDANTYDLIECSDWVVTFGSTVSVEACWMGKPVILLGASFYDSLDVSYTPQSVEEFLELLPQDLPAKDRINAARFATYEQFDCNELRYVTNNGRRMVGKGIRVHQHILAQLARSTDDVLCNLVKMWSRSGVNRKAA